MDPSDLTIEIIGSFAGILDQINRHFANTNFASAGWLFIRPNIQKGQSPKRGHKSKKGKEYGIQSTNSEVKTDFKSTIDQIKLTLLTLILRIPYPKNF
jgi:hypothetical protein